MTEDITKHRHFIIYKPYGYLSQFASNASKQQSKKFLGDLHDFPEGIMAIGRLDEKSEGLLLLTTDGKMSDFVNSKKVDKEIKETFKVASYTYSPIIFPLEVYKELPSNFQANNFFGIKENKNRSNKWQ